MPNIKIAADLLEEQRSFGQVGQAPLIVSKVDVTRDLRGSLYAKEEWKEKHQEIAVALEEKFGTAFKDNGNSFNSCF